MKEIWNKPSKKYHITNEIDFNSEDVVLGTAYNAICYYSNEESLVITSNETGEVLFQYDGGSVKWMDGDFARALLARFAGR